MPLGAKSSRRPMAMTTRRRRQKRPRFNLRQQIQALRPERKYFDTYITAATIASAANMTGGEVDQATVLNLCSPEVGTAPNQRVGRVIKLKSVHVEGRVRLASDISAAGIPPSYGVFIALVWDKQTNGAQLNSEDVFTNVSATVTNNSCPFRNINYGHRFIVLREEHYSPDPQFNYAAGSYPVAGWSVPFKFFYKFPKGGIPVTFQGTGGTVSSILDNSLHMVAFCTNTGPLIDYNARVRFTDV